MLLEQTYPVPKHLAVILDGNGRWAKARNLPRTLGHQAGVKKVRRLVTLCAERAISYLTVFAFSSENWQRPKDEVHNLMALFLRAIRQELPELIRNGVRLNFIGDASMLSASLQQSIQFATSKTMHGMRLHLNVAINYGGRWDIVQAAKQLAQNAHPINEWDEELFNSYTALGDMPAPDLLIRTGGEMRISNYLLWQMAYAELYFTTTLWPDFDAQDLDDAINVFAKRERRFGKIETAN